MSERMHCPNRWWVNDSDAVPFFTLRKVVCEHPFFNNPKVPN